MKIGNKIKCSNGHTYTIGNGDGFYTFSLIDEFGDVVTLVMDYYLEDCLKSDHEEYIPLCLGYKFNQGIYTDVLELIK